MEGIFRIMEGIFRKIMEIKSKIGGRFLMRNSISGDIRLAEVIEKKEDEEEVVKLEDVIGEAMKLRWRSK